MLTGLETKKQDQIDPEEANMLPDSETQYSRGSGLSPERLAAPPVGSCLQRMEGNPTTARCAALCKSQTMPTLLLPSYLAHLLPIEETAQPGTSEAVSLPMRLRPCGAKGSCGVPGIKRPHEPAHAPCTESCLPGPRADGSPCRRALLCLPALAYLVALYAMFCWTVSCRAVSAS
jgi:hypothetical protein